MDTLITAFIAPVVVAAIISAIVSLANNNKTMSLKYITEERAAWRKEIKGTVSKLYSGNYNPDELKELITLLILNLNPLIEGQNNLDRHIIYILKKIEDGDNSMSTLEDLRESIGLLLKHDWERSKNETKGFFTKEPDDYIKARTLQKYYEPVQKNKTR